MKTQKIKVSRTVEVPGQKDVERATEVTFRSAETAAEALELCSGNIETFMSYFNTGRWSEFRTKVSNALANKTPQQRAVDKMIAAFQTLNPSLTDQQARQLILSMPNMTAATQTGTDAVLPAEIDETYFDTRKAEKEENGKDAEKESEPQPEPANV